MSDEYSNFKLSPGARLALAAGLFSIGALIQSLLGWGFWPGIAAIVIGYLPLRLKAVSNKPADQGLEEWRPVSMAEVDRLADALRESKKARMKLFGGNALAIAVSAILLLAAGVSRFFSPDLSLVIFDGWLFTVPALFFGRVRAFVPPVLNLKMPCFQAVFAEGSPDGIKVTPYLRFDKDADGRDVPEDIRLMIEPVRKPADFVGIQVQAAINKGPSGEVPYMYAVALTKGKGTTYNRIRRFSQGGYEVEPGGDDEYGSVVIRQVTSGTGYATKPSDCARLFRVALSVLPADSRS